MSIKKSLWFVHAKTSLIAYIRSNINNKLKTLYWNKGVQSETADEAKLLISKDTGIPVEDLGIQYGIHKNK